MIRLLIRHQSAVKITRVSTTYLNYQAKTMATDARPKVFVTRRVPVRGIDLLKDKFVVSQWDREDRIPREELLRGAKGVDALFCLLTDKIDKDVLDAAGPQLKTISTMSVGYEHIDLTECKKRNIPVGFTPDVLTNATAELTMSLLLATSRRLKEGMIAVEDGSWGTWNPIWMLGHGLDGATVGIVGLGRIGLAVAKCLLPFGVSRIIYSGNSQSKNEQEVNAEFVTFNNLLEHSDFILGCCSLTANNIGLFNAEAFNKMKTSAIFVNTSRGGLVNQDDLYNALKSGKIAGAGLDVTTPEPLPTDSPLLTLNNCLVLPHIGSATEKARSAMSELTARNIIAVFENKEMPSRLNIQ
ncbi:glyoxylate reductase/hydroxypyruvate reductase-like [Mytilus californianus]|uniref:glyoxylate reductase/hydroxypyruvate reductase-like n=1 Tax=Mytilus californianus TaxID=6549 RepID=UPI002245A1B6|nr:glyoxylate reductase/hydroxypyruvate reductase-like [Mytilus californianus]